MKLLLIFCVFFCFTVTSGQQKSHPVNGNKENQNFTKVSNSKTSEQSFFQAKVHGRVTNQNGEAIPGATVMVMELGSGTVTSSTGHYNFQLPPGKYRIQYNYIGCQQVEVPRVLMNDIIYKIDVQLNCELSAGQSPNFRFRTIKSKIIMAKPIMVAPIDSLESTYLEGTYPEAIYRPFGL